MAIRRETRNILIGSAIGLAVLVILGLILGSMLASWVNGGVPASSPQSDGVPSVTASAVPTPSATTEATPPIPTQASSSPTAQPLPQGDANPVDPPNGAVTNGYTAGDLTDPFNAPAYSVKVPTATVNEHWGFTYTYQCDPSTDDTWRQTYPDQGSFSVRLGSNYLLRGTAYNGSGTITHWSSSGPTTHKLVISGPCQYELDYFYYN